MLNAFDVGRLLPTRTMVLDRREKYTRTEYAKAYDAGCFGHSGAVFRNYLRQRNFTVLGYTPILRL